MPTKIEYVFNRLVDEMSEEEFNLMMQKGLEDAKAGNSRLASEVFNELREELTNKDSK